MSPPTEFPTVSTAKRMCFLHPRWLLAIVVAAGLMGAILIPRLFDKLGQPDYGHWFLDSYAILAANDAVTAGLNPYEPNPLDRLKRPHVYSDWWLELGRFGLTRQDNLVFGGGCVLAFLAVAMASARPKTWLEAFGFAAVLLSPPVLLALNRANNDLVIFALIGAPLRWLHHSTTPWRIGLLAAALVAATGLKYYPIAAIVALAILDRPSKRALWFGGATVVMALAVLWSERTALARGAFPLPDTVYLFGSPEIWRELGLSRGLTLALSVGVIGLLASTLVRLGLTRGLGESTDDAMGERWSFAVGALLLTGCFLAGTSFAYRWVFSWWLLPWLWLKAGGPSRPAVAKIALGVLLLSLWQDGIYCLVLNLCLQRVPAYWDIVWHYLSHAVNWTLIALLAGWLLDSVLRAARDAKRGLVA